MKKEEDEVKLNCHGVLVVVGSQGRSQGGGEGQVGTRVRGLIIAR